MNSWRHVQTVRQEHWLRDNNKNCNFREEKMITSVKMMMMITIKTRISQRMTRLSVLRMQIQIRKPSLISLNNHKTLVIISPEKTS